jgi:hypothetical protein
MRQMLRVKDRIVSSLNVFDRLNVLLNFAETSERRPDSDRGVRQLCESIHLSDQRKIAERIATDWRAIGFPEENGKSLGKP